MDFYKKLIKSKKIRFAILSCFKFIPDELMLKLQYRIKCGKKLNLKSPKRYTEKLQWYKLHYRNPLMAKCADKYLVREYIQNKGLAHILNDLYAIYDTPEDIDISMLPDQFILKLSNGSSTNLVVMDKNKITREAIAKRFKDFYRQANSSAGREWCYHCEKSVIVAEKFLSDPSQPNGIINDYKILCFNGEPEYIICVSGRYTASVNHLTYDKNWNKVFVDFEGSRSGEDVLKPENLEEMLNVARKLSADFPFARIDLYSIEGKITFGEITFFPWSGYMRFNPDSFDYELGRKFILPKSNT